MTDSKVKTVSIRIFEETAEELRDAQAVRRKATKIEPTYAELVAEAWAIYRDKTDCKPGNNQYFGTIVTGRLVAENNEVVCSITELKMLKSALAVLRGPSEDAIAALVSTLRMGTLLVRADGAKS